MDESKDKREDGVLFEDLIEQASSIGTLNIEDRELTEFEPALAAAEAAGPRPARKTFGKRASRKVRHQEILAPEEETLQAQTVVQEEEPEVPDSQASSSDNLRRSRKTSKEPDFNVISPFGTQVQGNHPKSAIELLREEREAEKRREAQEEEEKEKEILEDAITTGALSEDETGQPSHESGDQKEVPEQDETTEKDLFVDEEPSVNAEDLFNQTGLAVGAADAKIRSEKTAVSVKENAGSEDALIFAEQVPAAAASDPEKGRVFEPDRVVSESLKVDQLSGSKAGKEELIDQNDPSLTSTITSLNLMSSAAASALLEGQRDEPDPDDEDEDDEDQIFDPSASLVDDYDYDLYQDKKHFLMSDYKKMEDYLEAQARQGYHYVSHEGKKFYFHKGEPSNDYYEAMYFTKEPVESQWQLWKDEGWEFVHRTEGKKRSDYGWIIFRHPEEPGQFRRVIDNNKEKYRFFRKYANSCRSTLFLLFICLVTSVITAFLQWEFKGYMAGIILCGVVFVISLYFCIVYARMLSKSRKQAQLLKARIRRMENMKNSGLSSEDAALENDWDELDEFEAEENEDD